MTVLVGAAVVAGPSIPAARADCVSTEAYITRSGSTTKQYLVGPKRCVAPTPLSEGVMVCGGDNVPGLPSGTPNGSQLCVWLPTP